MKAKLGKFAGSTTYVVGRAPKIVLFWHMDVEKEIDFVPNEEVDKLLWLSFEKALRKTQLRYRTRAFSSAQTLNVYSWYACIDIGQYLIRYRTRPGCQVFDGNPFTIHLPHQNSLITVIS